MPYRDTVTIPSRFLLLQPSKDLSEIPSFIYLSRSSVIPYAYPSKHIPKPSAKTFQIPSLIPSWTLVTRHSILSSLHPSKDLSEEYISLYQYQVLFHLHICQNLCLTHQQNINWCHNLYHLGLLSQDPQFYHQ